MDFERQYISPNEMRQFNLRRQYDMILKEQEEADAVLDKLPEHDREFFLELQEKFGVRFVPDITKRKIWKDEGDLPIDERTVFAKDLFSKLAEHEGYKDLRGLGEISVAIPSSVARDFFSTCRDYVERVGDETETMFTRLVKQLDKKVEFTEELLDKTKEAVETSLEEHGFEVQTSAKEPKPIWRHQLINVGKSIFNHFFIQVPNRRMDEFVRLIKDEAKVDYKFSEKAEKDSLLHTIINELREKGLWEED